MTDAFTFKRAAPARTSKAQETVEAAMIESGEQPVEGETVHRRRRRTSTVDPRMEQALDLIRQVVADAEAAAMDRLIEKLKT